MIAVWSRDLDMANLLLKLGADAKLADEVSLRVACVFGRMCVCAYMCVCFVL